MAHLPRSPTPKRTQPCPPSPPRLPDARPPLRARLLLTSRCPLQYKNNLNFHRGVFPRATGHAAGESAPRGSRARAVPALTDAAPTSRGRPLLGASTQYTFLQKHNECGHGVVRTCRDKRRDSCDRSLPCRPRSRVDGAGIDKGRGEFREDGRHAVLENPEGELAHHRLALQHVENVPRAAL